MVAVAAAAAAGVVVVAAAAAAVDVVVLSLSLSLLLSLLLLVLLLLLLLLLLWSSCSCSRRWRLYGPCIQAHSGYWGLIPFVVRCLVFAREGISVPAFWLLLQVGWGGGGVNDVLFLKTHSATFHVAVLHGDICMVMDADAVGVGRGGG